MILSFIVEEFIEFFVNYSIRVDMLRSMWEWFLEEGIMPLVVGGVGGVELF